MNNKKIPLIVGITYSIEIPEGVLDKIFTNDGKKQIRLTEVLRNEEEIHSVEYDLGYTHLLIHILTDSVKKYDPSKNPVYWQGICQIIDNHIKQEE